MDYGRAELLSAYLGIDSSAYDQEMYGEYEDARSAWSRGLTGALGALLGVDLLASGSTPGHGDPVLWFHFRQTLHSYRAQQTPTSGMLEGGLLIMRLEESGERGQLVLDRLGRMAEHLAASRELHQANLETLLELLLGDRAELRFSPDDLRAAGFDPDTRPSRADYPEPDY
jgi:hypothetical protein